MPQQRVSSVLTHDQTCCGLGDRAGFAAKVSKHQTANQPTDSHTRLRLQALLDCFNCWTAGRLLPLLLLLLRLHTFKFGWAACAHSSACIKSSKRKERKGRCLHWVTC